MRKRNLLLSLIIMGCLLVASAVGGSARTQSTALTGSAKDFERAKFDKSSTHITNQWLPLRPGLQLTYKGSAIPEGEKTRVKRRVVSTVTDLSKWIDGVSILVTWEKDCTPGTPGERDSPFSAHNKAS